MQIGFLDALTDPQLRNPKLVSGQIKKKLAEKLQVPIEQINNWMKQFDQIEAMHEFVVPACVVLLRWCVANCLMRLCGTVCQMAAFSSISRHATPSNTGRSDYDDDARSSWDVWKEDEKSNAQTTISCEMLQDKNEYTKLLGKASKTNILANFSCRSGCLACAHASFQSTTIETNNYRVSTRVTWYNDTTSCMTCIHHTTYIHTYMHEARY